MTIELPVILLNIYYIGVAVALLIRDILWLRAVMMIAGASVIAYGINTSNPVVIFWNCIFISINVFQVIRLILERQQVKVEDELLDIYKNIFPEMTPREFLSFWHMGTYHTSLDETLCSEGQIQPNLMLLVQGQADVIRDGHAIARLERGSFVAEMGFIAKQPASADVTSRGRIEYISWSRKKLSYMEKANPALFGKLQIILSKDLVHKLKQHG